MIKLFGQSQIMKGDETIEVYREGTAIPEHVVYKDGKPIKRGTIKFFVRGNVQPLDEKDLLLVPEGDRYKEQMWIYLMNQVPLTEEGLEIQMIPLIKDQDQIIREGIYWQVQGVGNWGSYTRARIMRIDVGPTATQN